MNYSYFAARSDAAAIAVLDRPGSPGQSSADAGLLSELVDGVGFSQDLGYYADLILGGGTDVDLEDWEHRIDATTDERRVILRVPPILVRAIADTDIEHLHSLVPAWAQFPHFAERNPDRLRTFATDLHRLCRTATEANGGVYSYGWA